MKTVGTVVIISIACAATVASSPPLPCEENGVFQGSVLEGFREEFTAQPADGSSSQLFKGAEARAVLSKCTEIDVIFGFVSISDNFYPALKKVGFIGPYNFFDPYTSIEELNGFESVEELGDVVGFQRISGLNNVKESGSLRSVKIDGMRSLERALSIVASETDGLTKVTYAESIRKENTPDGAIFLPNLEQVNGNFVINDGSESELFMPKIHRISGSVSVTGTNFVRWIGFAEDIAIGGDLIVYENSLLSSQYVRDWIAGTEPKITGDTVICKNGNEQQLSCPNDFVFQEPE
jgi:hypothetical protein